MIVADHCAVVSGEAVRHDSRVPNLVARWLGSIREYLTTRGCRRAASTTARDTYIANRFTSAPTAP